jgi:acyl carrier protein
MVRKRVFPSNPERSKMPSEAPQTAQADAAAVERWMVAYITSVIDVAQDPFPVAESFDTYGLDSVEITIMCGMMEEEFGIEVNPEEVFDHPSVSSLAEHIARRIGERSAAA